MSTAFLKVAYDCEVIFGFFAGNFIVFGNFLGRRAFPGNNYGKPAIYWGRNQRPDKKRKRTDNFLVKRILLFLAHLKSPVPATVAKNFASIFYSHTVYLVVDKSKNLPDNDLRFGSLHKSVDFH